MDFSHSNLFIWNLNVFMLWKDRYADWVDGQLTFGDCIISNTFSLILIFVADESNVYCSFINWSLLFFNECVVRIGSRNRATFQGK
ncbi:hypothetical protein RIF29_20267 [Crotalaria pallida]|uniref:Uncharacterized protein n=1 Tax=Crotalaria pallida TaxID=3830 RepID=A0AAN9F2L6_CROPI